ncbi:MAG: putative undecaprenyl-phosphate galactose phosphotransferase [Bacteroidota bacterium]|jgi:lipopolysaccharide/colanic/teichoic acid biosynthesis glycosyltransferase
MTTKRFSDLFFALFALLLLAPFLGLLAAIIALNSRGGVLYRQIRIGKNGLPFAIFKFRTMYADADKRGLLTVGDRDPRVTPVGFYLRKYKIDELPQLLNVLLGEMSLVGPRPEVQRYTDLYTAEQRKVLTVKPGITDYASIEYADESELLAKANDPEKTYIEEIMPAKLALNRRYIAEQGVLTDIKILALTVLKIVGKGGK